MPFYLYSLKLFLQALKDIFFFPIWWYSFGLFEFLIKIKEFIVNKERSLALSVWAKNIFTPMFGQNDWQGYLISFFIRSAQVIFRTIVMIFWLIVAFIFLCVWLALPILVIYQILFQLNVVDLDMEKLQTLFMTF